MTDCHGQHRRGDGLLDSCCQAVVPIERRWNLAASASGFVGSEFVDEPERVFADFKELRERQRVRELGLRRELRELRAGR